MGNKLTVEQSVRLCSSLNMIGGQYHIRWGSEADDFLRYRNVSCYVTSMNNEFIDKIRSVIVTHNLEVNYEITNVHGFIKIAIT